jgi:hypothetical protein
MVASQMAPELLDDMPVQTIGSTTTVVETTTPGDATTTDNNTTTTTTTTTEDEADTADENSVDLVTTTTKTTTTADDELLSHELTSSNNIDNDINITRNNISSISTTNPSAITTTNDAVPEEFTSVVELPTQNGNTTSTTTEQSDESNLEQPALCVVAANGKNKNGMQEKAYDYFCIFQNVSKSSYKIVFDIINQ